MGSFKPVRSVLRALEVLAYLGRHSDATVSELHRNLTLAKPTVVRLLETLMEAGYVTRDEGKPGYRITDKVYGLTGFQGGPLLIQATRSHALALTRRFKWPVSIAVLDHSAMRILYSTMTESPISWMPSGRQLPLLTRALGRAYLAYCSDEQQKLLLRIISKSENPEDRLVKVPRYWRTTINRVRNDGFAERDPTVEPRRQTTLAVPVMVANEPIATLGLTYYVSAVPRREAIDRYVPALKRAARAIGSYVERMSPH